MWMIPRRCCACDHWRIVVPQRSPDGYLLAECQEPKDERDRKWMRGSDTCSRWARKGCA
jgi:hypothetical protein